MASMQDLSVRVEAAVASVVAHVETPEFKFTDVSWCKAELVLRSMNFKHVGNVRLPEAMVHAHPTLYHWAVGMSEVGASTDLRRLLNSALSGAGVACKVEDVQSLAGHAPLNIVVESCGNFSGCPDVVGVHSSLDDVVSPFTVCYFMADWKTPTKFSITAKIRGIAVVQLLALREVRRGDGFVPPVFVTDWRSGMRCWLFHEECLFQVCDSDDGSLTLAAGVALMAYLFCGEFWASG
jgi:hypothetical protein